MKSSIRFVLSVMMALTFAFSAFAQVTTANIGGKVTDEAGAVAGAPVIAVYVPTGTTYYGVTDVN